MRLRRSGRLVRVSRVGQRLGEKRVADGDVMDRAAVAPGGEDLVDRPTPGDVVEDDVVALGAGIGGDDEGVAIVQDLARREHAPRPRGDAANKTIHVILAVRDRGTPALASHRRAVVNCVE